MSAKGRANPPARLVARPATPRKAQQPDRHFQRQDDRVSKLATFTLSPECKAKLQRLHDTTGKPKSNIVEMAIMAIRETGGADADA